MKNEKGGDGRTGKTWKMMGRQLDLSQEFVSNTGFVI